MQRPLTQLSQQLLILQTATSSALLFLGLFTVGSGLLLSLASSTDIFFSSKGTKTLCNPSVHPARLHSWPSSDQCHPFITIHQFKITLGMSALPKSGLVVSKLCISHLAQLLLFPPHIKRKSKSNSSSFGAAIQSHSFLLPNHTPHFLTNFLCLSHSSKSQGWILKDTLIYVTYTLLTSCLKYKQNISFQLSSNSRESCTEISCYDC